MRLINMAESQKPEARAASMYQKIIRHFSNEDERLN